jgi:tetratricopeptide (TPR) repeat protein
MSKETQDRDAIVSKAIGMKSADERNAFIAQACDNNAELKHQVEERVAEHFQSQREEKPPPAADSDKPSPEQAKPKPAQEHESLREMARKHPRAVAVTAGTLLILLVAAVAGVSLMGWMWRKEGQARKAEQEAVHKEEQAQKGEAAAKGQFHQSEAARKVVEKERDRAKAEEKATRRSEEDTRAVLDFLKTRLLSAGRPADLSISEAFWAKGQDKDMTLRKAVDAAEAQVADAFANNSLREAMVREMLGAAYLNLGEAAPAVKQYERALALRESVQGVNDEDTAACRNKLAVAYRLAGRTADAARLIDYSHNTSAHASALAVDGSILLTQKKPADAELKLRQCVAIREKLQPDDWNTFDAKSMLGEALLDQKKYSEAEPLLLSGYKGLKKHEAKIPSQSRDRLTRALERLVRLYEGWGKKEKVDQWRKELEETKSARG